MLLTKCLLNKDGFDDSDIPYIQMIAGARSPAGCSRETATVMELLCHWYNKEAMELFMRTPQLRKLFLYFACKIKREGKTFTQRRGKRILTRA